MSLFQLLKHKLFSDPLGKVAFNELIEHEVCFRLLILLVHGICKLPQMPLLRLLLVHTMPKLYKTSWGGFPLSTPLYLFSVQLNALHRLTVTEDHHLLNDVHLVVDINGFMKSPII